MHEECADVLRDQTDLGARGGLKHDARELQAHMYSLDVIDKETGRRR